MRAVLVLGVIACAACSDPQTQWSGNGPRDPAGGAQCSADSDCGADVCAHTGQCYPASGLRTVHAMWTINGAAPDATSCGNGLRLILSFTADLGGYGQTEISFAPVACLQGQFTLDKLPMVFDGVTLEGFTNDHDGRAFAAVDDATGEAKMDLKLM